ncbi:hypothetical protein BBJ28_00008652 [Nothophytophthora sp. Chile5]|nr:hypothetical protein BBJ28_00008652 [Nothophytophthora sp. Chile5]
MRVTKSTKLSVHAAAGGSEAVHLALYLGEVAFKVSYLPANELSQGQTPVLEAEGVVLTRSQAALRYVGRLAGSYPVNAPFVALKIDEIMHALSEVDAEMACVRGEANADQKELLKEELVKATIPRYAKQIEARLERLPALHSNGNRPVIHEIALYCWTRDVRSMGFDGLEKYKLLHEAATKVEEHPRMKQRHNLQSCNEPPKLKLTYLPFPGRAEPIRLALFIGGFAFEDERIDGEELNRRRSTLPFNQLPVLEVGGVMVSQALAILRYAGTISGLYSPSAYMEALRIDEVFALVDEFYSSQTWNASYFEKDPTKQKELRKTLAEVTLPKTLGFLEARIARWGGVHCVGAKLTVADLAVYSLMWTFQSGRIAGVPVSVVAPYENLLRVYHTVSSHPKVVEWNAVPH